MMRKAICVVVYLIWPINWSTLRCYVLVFCKIVKLESDLSTCNANVVKVKEKVDEKTSAIDKRIIQLEKEVNKINGKFGDLDATFHRTVEYKLSTEIEKMQKNKRLVSGTS